MVSRERILEAAARVYAKHGFKGATTRLIAIEAEVNEVTLFRTFGSKGALLEAVLMHNVGCAEPVALPAEPVDPLRELTDFIDASMQRINQMRPILIHTMGESEMRPEAMDFACQGRHHVHDTITTYLRQLQKMELADRDVDVNDAAVILVGTVMSDVMGRPIVPDVYPSVDEAPRRYATLFLRTIGYRADARTAAPATSTAKLRIRS
jgi:AcrR family transcriptional regulator